MKKAGHDITIQYKYQNIKVVETERTELFDQKLCQIWKLPKKASEQYDIGGSIAAQISHIKSVIKNNF